MKRRSLIAAVGAASALAMPALSQSSRKRTLIFTPVGALSILDPSFTTAAPPTNHGYYVFDTLYSVDANNQARPQMAAGHNVADDGLTWEIKLRPGLKFTDKEPVLARDCVASIKRWGYRDAFGSSLLSYCDDISALNDTTIRFRLKRPFGILPDALAHPVAIPCFIMPERIALTDVSKPVTEMVGSGPFRFVADEFVAGDRAVYAKNTSYVPRDEKADGMSGGKVVYFDRVEWRAVPDFATAAAALRVGEIDWWESVQFDLANLLRGQRGVTVVTSDPRCTNFLRFNCGIAPFNNPALRRAVAAVIDQSAFTQALVGDDPSLQSTCFAMYRCGLPGVGELGKSQMGGPKNIPALTEQIRKAGYNGEKIVMLDTHDLFTLAPMSPVLVDALTKVGMNVDVQTVDLATLVARRTSQASVDQGGWSLFVLQAASPILANPVVDVVARGLGAKGFPGNYEDPQLEADVMSWIGASNDDDRHSKLNVLHQRLWDMMPIVPLGSYSMQTAFRSNLTGYLSNTTPVPWNIRRTS